MNRAAFPTPLESSRLTAALLYVRTQTHVLLQPSAILDLHFQTTPGSRDQFAVVSSTATLSVFRLSPTGPDPSHLEALRVICISGFGEDILFLSCSWHPSIPDILAVTTSTGQVLLVNSQNGAAESVISHSLEAWTAAFSPPELGNTEVAAPFTLYSGGDDSILNHVSVTVNATDAGGSLLLQVPFPAARISGHQAGVTSILPSGLITPDGAQLVLTGSYDDCIRAYAIFEPGKAQGAQRTRLLAEKNLGGGVWRLRPVESVARTSPGTWRLTILASCMHAGCRVVEVSGDDTTCRIQVLARFEEHKSMNYASDYQPYSGGLRALQCVSTSFYDKLLCLWAWEREESA